MSLKLHFQCRKIIKLKVFANKFKSKQAFYFQFYFIWYINTCNYNRFLTSEVKPCEPEEPEKLNNNKPPSAVKRKQQVMNLYP